MIPILGIPIVNGFHWLQRLIDSIDFPIDTVVILNNNSDDTELTNNLEQLQQNNNNANINQIKICNLPGNIGVAASWNLMIKANINSPYWLICNNDIAFTPGLLLEFYNQAQHTDIGIAHGSGGDFGDGGYDLFLIKDWVVQEIGLFDENLYPAYCEDADYIMRIHNYRKNKNLHTVCLNIPYYHGDKLSSDPNCYLESGRQTGRQKQGLMERLDQINIQNFEYMNNKWGNSWRITNPQEFALNIQNMPLTYTSYDLNFCRSKFIDFNIEEKQMEKTMLWGPTEDSIRDIITQEIFVDKVYEKYYKVKSQDIIVDIGANCGAFTYSLQDSNIKHAFCLEPSKVLFPILEKNLKNNISCTLINKGIADTNDDKIRQSTDFIYYDNSDSFSAITFKNFIDTYNITKVNLLKFDCEGCEYNIFNETNSDFIKNNVENIAGEYHIVGFEDSINNFKIFRDIYLKDLQNTDNFHIFERGGRDVSKEIFDDSYLESYKQWWGVNAPDYGQLMVYANFQSSNNKIFVNDSDPNQENGIIDTNILTINPRCDSRFFVVDNFYEDPVAVREFALSQTFFPGEGAVGHRTRKQFLFDGLKERFEQIIGQKIQDYTDDAYGWRDIGINGRFQYCPAGTNLVYHCDAQKWAAMVFLTPDAPPSCGTSFFRHKETKVHHNSQIDWDAGQGLKVFNQKTFLDGTPYERIDQVGNIFNRLVIFDGGLIHCASQYFGWDINTSRLFHIFFFN